MKKKSLWILFAAIIFATSSVYAAGLNWQSFSVGGYRVQMPGKPSCVTKVNATHGFHIVEHICIFNSKDLNVSTEYSDLPGIARTFEGKKGIYKKSIQAFLADAGGREVSSPDITISGQSGRQLNYTTGSQTGIAKFVMVKDRLYVIQAAVPSGTDKADMNKFLDSFSL